MESPACDTRREPGSIEKPNRTRPLRTYSKRAASVGTGELVSKKRRVGEAGQDATSQKKVAEITRDAHSPQSSLPDPPRPAQVARKGTIMDYFKVVSSASSSTLPSEPSSDSADPTTTPPSSPPMPKSKRKTRRKLTTRVMSQETETAGNGATGQGDEEGEESATAERASTEPREQTAIPANSSQGALDRAQAKAKKRSDAGKRGRGGAAPAGPRQATVQTTLSLALNEKVFTECKECTMLYNPFHEKDVRFHARRHAAMQRARRNSDGNISC